MNGTIASPAADIMLPGSPAEPALLDGAASIPFQNLPEVVSGASPLAQAANPVLNLVPQIRNTERVEDIATLRDVLIEAIRSFERRARQAGIAPETIIGARYCLCTLLDEAAALTPWGGSGIWSRHGMLVTFHNETWGGEKFFQLLSKLAQAPQQHRDLLGLMYSCICLGLQGRFRIVDNGLAQLETLRQRLWTILRDLGTGRDDALSPHWQGVAAGGSLGGQRLPVWVVACIVAALGIGGYLWYTFALAKRSDVVAAQISALQISAPPAPARPAPVRLAGFLEAEIRAGLVEVRDEADRSTIILRGDGLFNSGSSTVLPAYRSVLERIADALAEQPGEVVVSGYTDNIPIHTALYPSNYQLSQERAEHVADILRSRNVASSRLRARGLGEAFPVDDNASPEGRARNRRVEVELFAAPGGVGGNVGAVNANADMELP